MHKRGISFYRNLIQIKDGLAQQKKKKHKQNEESHSIEIQDGEHT